MPQWFVEVNGDGEPMKIIGKGQDLLDFYNAYYETCEKHGYSQ